MANVPVRVYVSEHPAKWLGAKYVTIAFDRREARHLLNPKLKKAGISTKGYKLKELGYGSHLIDDGDY